MALKSWRFSTHNGTRRERSGVWQEAMDAVRLPMPARECDENFHGDVVGLVSAAGIEFSRLSATPLTISGRYQNQPAGLWLALMLEGSSVFSDHGHRVELSCGDILYGPTGRDSTLELAADFRLLYLRIPGTALNPTLVNPETLRSGILDGQSRLTKVMCGMLRALGEELEAFDAEDIHPIEVALSEFVVASLATSHTIRCFGDRTRAAHFERICRSLDHQLSDADLTLARLTVQHHVSARYLQKLFEDAGTSFTAYLRDQRLDRCREDLINPAYKGLSVSEICFRRGFNDAPHFSRCFRARFGMTPRACRLKAGQPLIGYPD